MSASYLLVAATQKKTPQSQPIPGREKDMQRNNAGGFSFKADSWQRFERFLLLGSEGGTYYVSEQDLTKQNVDNVRACIAEDGVRAVRTIYDISVGGRAPKNDAAIYALALAASYGGSVETRTLALAHLPHVCRTGTHLFQFAAFIDTMRGWGPALRKAVAEWYLDRPTQKLAYQLLKYQSRNGWSNRDLMRLAHPKTEDASKQELFRWVINGDTPDNPMVFAYIGAMTDKTEAAAIDGIRKHGLTREMIPTEVQKSPKVWEALLEKMPMTAMIRTLGRMGACGYLAPMSEASREVVKRLGDREALRKQRVHPMTVLAALLTYKQGRGQKGSLTWQPVPQVVDALNDAFYKAFEFVEPTNKRFCVGVDVSGSMTMGSVAGMVGLTPNMGAAAMAMLIARTEPNYFIGGFSSRFVDLGITASDRLDSAMKKAQRDFGGTDCAVAINHALTNKMPVDVFTVITDGETWAGNQHASQALVNYRQKMGIDAKLIVIGMVPNATRLTDPADAGSLDIVGFDASVPALIAGFIGADNGAGSDDDSAE